MLVTLPLPPTANLYWRIWHGRAVVSSEARAYKQGAALAAKAQGLRPIVSGEVAVVLRVFRPARRGDLDNRIKVLLDALRGVAFRDDAQVSAIDARQFLDAANPRVEVEVAPLPAVDVPRRAHSPARPRKQGPIIGSVTWIPSVTNRPES